MEYIGVNNQFKCVYCVVEASSNDILRPDTRNTFIFNQRGPRVSRSCLCQHTKRRRRGRRLDNEPHKSEPNLRVQHSHVLHVGMNFQFMLRCVCVTFLPIFCATQQGAHRITKNFIVLQVLSERIVKNNDTHVTTIEKFLKRLTSKGMFIDTQRCKFERKVRVKIIFDFLSTHIEKFSNSTIDDY